MIATALITKFKAVTNLLALQIDVQKNCEFQSQKVSIHEFSSHMKDSIIELSKRKVSEILLNSLKLI